MKKRENVKHLKWIYNRMILVHEENQFVDYMEKFLQIIKDLENEIAIAEQAEINKRHREHKEETKKLVSNWKAVMTEVLNDTADTLSGKIDAYWNNPQYRMLHEAMEKSINEKFKRIEDLLEKRNS